MLVDWWRRDKTERHDGGDAVGGAYACVRAMAVDREWRGDVIKI